MLAPAPDIPELPQEDFDDLPTDVEGQARLAFAHLDLALEACGSKREYVVSLTRFLTNLVCEPCPLTVHRVSGRE
jgi:enamine deaminase RidA (YjgF/YER057c/UK114 family)